MADVRQAGRAAWSGTALSAAAHAVPATTSPYIDTDSPDGFLSFPKKKLTITVKYIQA
jgi:hypothetical protein